MAVDNILGALNILCQVLEEHGEELAPLWTDARTSCVLCLVQTVFYFPPPTLFSPPCCGRKQAAFRMPKLRSEMLTPPTLVVRGGNTEQVERPAASLELNRSTETWNNKWLSQCVAQNHQQPQPRKCFTSNELFMALKSPLHLTHLTHWNPSIKSKV